jgi:acetoacetate decarboxylase
MAQLPAGLQGRVTKDNFGSSMPSYGPLYPTFVPGTGWQWLDIDVVMIDYTTDAEAAAEWLPAEASLIDISVAPGQSAIKMIWANYRGGTLPPYKEVIQTIPCIFEDQLFLYVAQIWVDTDSAMASGRELGGFPKKLGDIGMDFLGHTWHGYLARPADNRIASFSFETTGKMLTVPLPADRTPTFPFPYNLALPLPQPSGEPQAVPYVTLQSRFIPNTTVGAEDPWSLAQLTAGVWTLEQGTIWAGDATLAFHPSEQDPLSLLPVNAVLSAMLFQGDMYLEDLAVVADL